MTIKVHLVGNEKPITIFFGENNNETNDENQEQEREIINSKMHLYPDDTILAIKQKILEELHGVLPYTLNSNDLYLFTTVYRQHTQPVVIEWIQHIQKQASIKKQVVFKQVLSNLGYSKKEIDETSVSIPEDINTETLDKWLINQKRIALGIRPTKTNIINAEFFPIHPFENYIEEITDIEWESHQNDILLEYGELVKPEIFVCIFNDIPKENRTKYGMTNRIIKTSSQMKETWKKLENQQSIYEWLQNNEKIESKTGITHLELEWIHPEYAVLPLEVIFKNIHANKLVPFIKWKNLFRLYCPSKDERGNKLPKLSKTEVAKIDRENVLPHLTLWTEEGVIIHLIKNGNLLFHIDKKIPLSVEKIQEEFLNTVIPIINQLNQYLQKTGFSYPVEWKSLFHNDPKTVIISNIKWSYSAKLEMETTIQKKQLGYFDPAFVLLKVDSEKKVSLANMVYRRVSNYDVNNELKEIVRLEFGNKEPSKTGKIVAELEERGYSREKIQMVIQEVLEELQAGKQYFQKKEKKNGSPVTMVQKHNEIHFTVENISFIEIIDLLKKYIETFIQQVFYKKKLPKSLVFPLTTIITVDEKEDNEIYDEENEQKVKDNENEKNNQEPVIEENEDITEDEINDEEATGVLLLNEEEDDDEDVSGIMLFNDEEDDDENDEKDDERQMNNEVKEMLQMNIPDVEESPSFFSGGAKKSNSSFSILNRLKERDPDVFDVPDQNGKVYSRICPGSSSRYPIVLTKEEKTRIDKKDKELKQSSYIEPLEYKNNTYICPRYWNFRENRSMTQSEFDKNPNLLQNIITDEKDINNDANDKYIYEFKKGKRFDKNDQYKEHVPGFSSKNKKGFCLPCCFSEKDSTFKTNIQECKSQDPNRSSVLQTENNNETEQPPQKMNAKEKIANANYILGINIYPLEMKRWGQIPPPVENIVQINKTDKNVLLRYGVERQENQSFFSCFSDLLDLSLKDTKKLLTTKIITLDKFVQYQTGSIASRFSNREKLITREPDTEKYQETRFYKSLDLENPDEYGFLIDTLKTYETFIDFINDDKTSIGPTYLWDIIATPDDNLFSTGLNIVVLEIETNEDTELHIMCPTELYSNTQFYDDTKPTWVLIKRPLLSGEEYYEPIYFATKKNGIRGAVIKDKIFLPEFAETVFPFLTSLEKSACFSSSSEKDEIQEKQINFREMDAKQIFNVFQKKGFIIKQQVVNRYGKTVGFVVENKEVNQYIPCFPSIFLPEKTVGERIRLNSQTLQKSLTTTIENLQIIKEKTGLSCREKVIVISNDNAKIIGIKTEYEGYIPVVPENYDPLNSKIKTPVEYSSDPIEAEMQTGDGMDTENDLSKKYFLENEFFLAFQGKMRNILNHYDNEPIRRQILRWINYKPTTLKEGNLDDNATFLIRYNRVLKILRQVAQGKIIFNDFDKRVLDKLQGVFACQTEATLRTEPQPYCLLRNGGKNGEEDKMIFPKKNLVNPENDNETIYFSKLADALVRNHRIQNIIFQPFRFFNMLGSVDYQINEDELLVG